VLDNSNKKLEQNYNQIDLRVDARKCRVTCCVRITLGRLLPHARGLGFKPRRGGFPSGAKKEWGLSPKANARVLHTAPLDVTPFIFDIDGRTLEYGTEDFCLITGFRFGKVNLDPDEEDHSKFRMRIFPKIEKLKGEHLLELVNKDVKFTKLDDEDVVLLRSATKGSSKGKSVHTRVRTEVRHEMILDLQLRLNSVEEKLKPGPSDVDHLDKTDNLSKNAPDCGLNQQSMGGVSQCMNVDDPYKNCNDVSNNFHADGLDHKSVEGVSQRTSLNDEYESVVVDGLISLRSQDFVDSPYVKVILIIVYPHNREPNADRAMAIPYLCDMLSRFQFPLYYADGVPWFVNNVQKVYFPINEKDSHWIPLFLDNAEVFKKKNTVKDDYSINFQYADGVPIQGGLYGDCGLWVCIFLYRLSHNIPLEVDDPISFALAYHKRLIEFL
nr:ulp1 protease family, C-terminal catalytic domain-containing protein [Tanacetum cinerariifolium]